MKYRTNSMSSFHDKELLSKYIIKECLIGKFEFFILEFCDEDLDDIRRILITQEVGIYYFSREDDVCYEMTSENFDKSSYERPFSYWESNFNFVSKIFIEEHRRITAILNLHKISKIVDSKYSSIYKKYQYIDKENESVISYRFKTSKLESSPLVIFLHGGGGTGFDNKKQMIDFLSLRYGLRGKDCNVLLPQAPVNAQGCNSKEYISYYLQSLKSLIDTLVASKSIDSNRIYLAGASYGGGLAWQMLYQYTEFFACGVPAIGRLELLELNKELSLDKLKNESIWIAHAEDDKIVPVWYDDYCYQELKNLNANVLYTRTDKGGHSMANKFFRGKNVTDWMFEQRLK